MAASDCIIQGTFIKSGDALIAIQGISVLFMPFDSIITILAATLINDSITLTFHRDIKTLPLQSLQARRNQIAIEYATYNNNNSMGELARNRSSIESRDAQHAPAIEHHQLNSLGSILTYLNQFCIRTHLVLLEPGDSELSDALIAALDEDGVVFDKMWNDVPLLDRVLCAGGLYSSLESLALDVDDVDGDISAVETRKKILSLRRRDMKKLSRQHAYTAGKVLMHFMDRMPHRPLNHAVCALFQEAMNEEGQDSIKNELITRAFKALPRSNISFLGAIFSFMTNLLQPENAAENGFNLDLICVIFAPLIMLTPDPMIFRFLFSKFNDYVLTKDYVLFLSPIHSIISNTLATHRGGDYSLDLHSVDKSIVGKLKKRLTEDALQVRRKSDPSEPDATLLAVNSHFCVDGTMKTTVCEYDVCASAHGGSKNARNADVCIEDPSVPLNAKIATLLALLGMLPQPVIPFHLHISLLSIAVFSDMVTRVRLLKPIVSFLPPFSFRLLKRLIAMLKMSSSPPEWILRTFGPLIFRSRGSKGVVPSSAPAPDTASSLAGGLDHAKSEVILSDILSAYEYLFDSSSKVSSQDDEEKQIGVDSSSSSSSVEAVGGSEIKAIDRVNICKASFKDLHLGLCPFPVTPEDAVTYSSIELEIESASASRSSSRKSSYNNSPGSKRGSDYGRVATNSTVTVESDVFYDCDEGGDGGEGVEEEEGGDVESKETM